MNKDLDDRLIPNGEYRDAQNISVGKSEADDIGALETVIGNSPASSFGLSNPDISVIGYYSDNNSDRIFVFLTDYTDLNVDPTPPSSTNNCYIYEFTPNNNGFDLLVSGIFLNFSKNRPITGVDTIENLLFFTDNRNQPRKINITTAKANSSYYKTETDISVAKYNPYEAISLLNKISKATSTTSGSTSTLTFANTTGITKGMAVVEYGNAELQPEDYVHVLSFTATVVTLSKAVGNIASGDTIYFFSTTMTGQDITLDFNGGVAWPGDPNFLEDKFVRFSYRFRFDDGEYSIMAPFTQIGFIPKQKGYFLEGNENAAYRSTILEFMENGVQDIKLKIPLPDVQANIGIASTSTYKIIAIDILYKESDGISTKVLETIESFGSSSTDNTLVYDYQSRKPFRTLPTDQTVRVYDKVPVKALGQAVSGNRVIYGNFLDKYTSPRLLNYRVAVSPKSTSGIGFDNWAEYPNHSLKQNRTYQVGFILADKYGRQSDVILSNVDATIETDSGVVYGGSTVYAPYNSNNTNPNVRDWFGNALRVIVNNPGIQSGIEGNPSTSGTTNGQSGLYANPISDGFDISGITPTINTPTTIPIMNVPGFKYEFTATSSGGTVIANWGTRGGVSSTCQTPCSIDMAATLAITNGGTGYTVGDNLATTTLTGTGSNMKINILSVGFGGVITSAVVGGFSSSGGVNYFENDTIQPIQGTNTTSTITITANTGTLANIQVGDVITTSIAANSHLNGAVVTAILGSNSAGGLSPFAAWAVQINKPTAPGYVGPQGGDTTTYPLTFSRGGSVPAGIPVKGSFLRGEYIDYVEIEKITITGSVYTVYTKSEINESLYSLSVPASSPDNKFAYNINPEGWYSYKIVVKQQQQDYYNVYLPGILAGYPGQPLPTTTQENLVSSSSFYLNLGAGATKSNDLIQVGMVVTSDDPTEVIGNPTIITKKNANEFTFSITQSISVDELIFYRVPGELSLFPADEIGKTANIVLINDNINKVPRDLLEVGPDQKQFRSSVQLFGRVSNSGFNFNDQYFPGTLSDTVVSISTASDSNINRSTILDQNYSNLYQFDTNPLIARVEVQTQAIVSAVGFDEPAGEATNVTLATAPTPAIEVGMIVVNNQPLSVFYGKAVAVVDVVLTTTSFTCRVADGFSSGNILFVKTIGSPSGSSNQGNVLIEPTLAVYETEPIESLLDIFWETDTVGLINDLNNLISSTFTGAAGWSSNFSWVQPESLASGGNVSTGIFPVDSIGTNLTNTRLVDSNNNVVNSIAATNVNGSAVGIILQPTLAYSVAAWDGSYKITTTSDFVFLNDANTRNFTIESIIRNGPLSTDEISSELSLGGALTNVAPSFVIPTNPLVISGTTTGVVTTYLDTSSTSSRTSNGSINTTDDQAQLKWSIVAGGTGDLFFSINENTGALTKTVSSVLAGSYTLSIKLEDTWNGTTVSTDDPKSLTLVQNLTINNTASGFQFAASPSGTRSQSCSVLPKNPLCGDNFYYNTTRASATPQVGDVIKIGPGNNAAFAGEGYYSFNCSQTGVNNRHFFNIVKLFGESDDGVVDEVDTC